MRQDQPSQSAQGCAIARAAHQLLDHPLLLDDPLSLRIIGAAAEQELRSDLTSHKRGLRALFRANIVARSRFSEDALAAALNRGVRQYVVLGAGLDTASFRIAEGFPDLALFEVDHPASQALKRERLQQAQIGVPPRLSLVPFDFQRQRLPDVLVAAGLDVLRPAQFSWMGVLPYLPQHVIYSTLAYIGGLPKGTEVVFGYPKEPTPAELEQLRGAAKTTGGAARSLAQQLHSTLTALAEAGEPVLTPRLDADVLRQQLTAFGFSQLDSFDTADLGATYFQGRSDGLELRIPVSIMRARV
jgi:methyltransferase (TIGR00027 family)